MIREHPLKEALIEELAAAQAYPGLGNGLSYADRQRLAGDVDAAYLDARLRRIEAGIRWSVAAMVAGSVGLFAMLLTPGMVEPGLTVLLLLVTFGFVLNGSAYWLRLRHRRSLLRLLGVVSQPSASAEDDIQVPGASRSSLVAEALT